MIIGYARVSTIDQNLDMQKEKLISHGAKYIYEEKKSAKNLSRSALEECLENLHPNDTLLITKLDRLSRSLKDTIFLVDELKKKNIFIKSIDDGIDTAKSSGKMFLQFMSIMAEHERELILERTTAGRQRARDLGKLTGRPNKYTAERILAVEKYVTDGYSINDACKILSVPKSTYYRRRACLV